MSFKTILIQPRIDKIQKFRLREIVQDGMVSS